MSRPLILCRASAGRSGRPWRASTIWIRRGDTIPGGVRDAQPSPSGRPHATIPGRAPLRASPFPHTAVLALLLAEPATGKACDRPSLPPGSPDNGGLALPEGFEATVFHDGVGRARHLAVTRDGIVYVKLRRSPDRPSSRASSR